MLEIITPKKQQTKQLNDLAHGSIFSYDSAVYMKSDEYGANGTSQCMDLSDGELVYFRVNLEVKPATKAVMEVSYD